MPSDKSPAVLGGPPVFDEPAQIVRPRLPALEMFSDAFQQALETGNVTNGGPAVANLETRLSDYMGVDVIACNNGQSALMLMLRAAGVTAGEVIVPSFTFSATPHAVRWCGATPVFADISGEGGFCLDPDDVRRRITRDTVAVLGTDVYGIPCPYEALDSIATEHGILSLYDSAPAFGARAASRPIGSFGDAQIFSFHATKPFSTMEGGCITSHDPALIERAKALRNFGQTRGADCDEAGMNAKMMEVCALIGLEQLDSLDSLLDCRNRIASLYRDALSSVPGLTFAEVGNSVPSWLYFPIVVDPVEFGLNRDELVGALTFENIFARKYYEIPCHHMAAYRESRNVSLVETEKNAYSVVSLPVYNDMSDDECSKIADAIALIQNNAASVAMALVD